MALRHLDAVYLAYAFAGHPETPGLPEAAGTIHKRSRARLPRLSFDRQVDGIVATVKTPDPSAVVRRRAEAVHLTLVQAGLGWTAFDGAIADDFFLDKTAGQNDGIPSQRENRRATNGVLFVAEDDWVGLAMGDSADNQEKESDSDV